MYTKGFIKMYADHVHLDSAAIVDAYLRPRVAFARQGLHVETEAQIRARRQRELQLPMGSVLRVVAALTVAVVLGYGIRQWWVRRAAAPTPVAKPTALPGR